MNASAADLLREAVRDRHPNETFEKALGRIIRGQRGTFRAYMELVDQVRERARKDGTTLERAASAMAGEGI